MEGLDKEKKQGAAQDRQMQELKFIGLIASGIVHDFNNAIGIIRGYADLALRATPSSDHNLAYLKQIIEGADSAKNLAEKLRIFTRQKKPDFKLINIHSIVDQAVIIFKESLAAPIDLQQDIDKMCGAVLADADQIQQAVINLCNNANDAMGENGGVLKIILKEVDVGASLAEEYAGLNVGKYMQLTICDTGHGMDQEILKQIFEPFFTTKKTGENAGLGLSVVHAIVKGHKGEIIAESHSGEGAKFDVYLPLAFKDLEN